MKAKHVDLGPLPSNLSIRPEQGRQDMTSEMKTPTWHAMEGNAVIQEQGSRLEGLSAFDVKERIERFGPNKIREEKQVSAWEILLRQLMSFFNYVLYAAAIVAFIAKDFADASFICAILIINTGLSFIQEYKATRAIQSLKNLIEQKIKVIRDGSPLEVDVTEVVPGDIIPLEEGMKVPADGRLVEEHALFIDEAMLTGESVPAEKEVAILSQEVPLAERTNMVFAGTTVVKGTGKTVITETGMNTELGKIAQALQESEIPPTSFELEVDKLSKNITFVISGLVVLVAFTGIVVYAFARIYIIRAFDTIRFFQNPWLIYSLVFAAVVQLFIIYCPQVNDFFGLHILDWKAWTVLGILGLWASTTGVWTSRWVESWAGHVINTSGVEKSRMRKVRKSLQRLGDKGSRAIE